MTAQLLDLSGNIVELPKRSSEHVTVAIFTRTDCPISNRLAPEIIYLYEKFQPRGVEFNLIYVDPDEQPDAIRQHLHDYRYPCRALRDPQHALVEYCHATVTPEAAVFNGRDSVMTYVGRITDQFADVGNARPQAQSHDLADAIEAALNGTRVTSPRNRAVGCPIGDLKE